MNALSLALPLLFLAASTPAPAPSPAKGARPVARIERTEAEWKSRLTPQQFQVLRLEGTERAFSGRYWNEHRRGRYVCAGCGLELFASTTKFESGTGWPSFWTPVDEGHVTRHVDESWGMRRVEVECARCGGHLGHVFDDGPRPTGLRYCINSVSLEFEPAK